MIQYPAGLPLPLRNGYGFTPVSAVLRSTMESGRARQRRRYASVPTMASVSWLFSAPQAQLFEAWFEDALNSGSEWFETRLNTPQGLMPYKARFVDTYTGPVLAGVNHWGFTADLELWEKPVLRGGWGLYAPEYIAQMALLDIAINREWPQ